jgi:hypothetical protein
MKQTLRNSVLFLVIFAFFWKDMVSIAYQLDYILNQQDYLKKCVNKSRPILKCNGKCHLAKKLQKVENSTLTKDKKPGEKPVKIREFEVYTIYSNFPTYAFVSQIFEPRADLLFVNHYTSADLEPLYHPPIA